MKNMLVPMITQKGEKVCELDISGMPHLDASFEYQKKHYKIIKVEESKNEKDYAYTCIVKSITKRMYEQ